MSSKPRIGNVSRVTGIAPKTIRFYEDEGLISPAGRTEAGYRVYDEGDVTRLRFIRGARLLGLGLPQIRSLLDKALGESCAAFGGELNEALSAQLEEVDRRMAELTAMRDELVRLQDHVDHCCEGCDPDQMASECSFCSLLTDEKGGE